MQTGYHSVFCIVKDLPAQLVRVYQAYLLGKSPWRTNHFERFCLLKANLDSAYNYGADLYPVRILMFIMFIQCRSGSWAKNPNLGSYRYIIRLQLRGTRIKTSAAVLRHHRLWVKTHTGVSATGSFSAWAWRDRGLYFDPKMIYPPFQKLNFFLLATRHFFCHLSCLFCLNSFLFCIYFNLLVPIFSFSFPFPSFSLHFLLFSLCFSYFFPWMTSANIPPSTGGEVFYNIHIEPCGGKKIPRHFPCHLRSASDLSDFFIYISWSRSSDLYPGFPDTDPTNPKAVGSKNNFKTHHIQLWAVRYFNY